MAAAPERIAFVLSPFRRAIAEDTQTSSIYGSLARKSEDPVETFFDTVDDADAMAQERLSLLSEMRRRFDLRLNDVTDVLALDPSGTLPVATYSDASRKITARPAIISEIAIDLSRGSASIMIWG